jgi:hypothetical protein
MTNRFSLTRKTDKESGPVSLRKIDKELCQRLGIIVDHCEYYNGWVDTIGIQLAEGQSFTDIIQECDRNMAEYPEDNGYYSRKRVIAQYLSDNFISDAWAEIARL